MVTILSTSPYQKLANNSFETAFLHKFTAEVVAQADGCSIKTRLYKANPCHLMCICMQHCCLTYAMDELSSTVTVYLCKHKGLLTCSYTELAVLEV